MFQRLLLQLLNRLAADTACRLGGTLGVLAWRLGIRRRLAARQMEDCLGLRGPDRARILRRSYASMGAQFLQVWTIGGPDGPEGHVTIANPGWAATVVRRHPAAVFLTCHLGDWDMAAHAMTRLGGEVLVYAKAQHNPEMDRLLNQRREAAGLRVVLVQPKDRTGAVVALKSLRRRTALGIMADQRPAGGTAAWFLGREAWCFDGPAFFARKAGVPIVPGFAVRRRAGVSMLFVGRPFAASGDHAVDVQRCMDQLSAMIAALPGQYFWQHRRFAGQPPLLERRAVEPWRGQGLRLIA
jgi:Kdo2-lipid IVA lauroyltransferase/acyltransferase